MHLLIGNNNNFKNHSIVQKLGDIFVPSVTPKWSEMPEMTFINYSAIIIDYFRFFLMEYLHRYTDVMHLANGVCAARASVGSIITLLFAISAQNY